MLGGITSQLQGGKFGHGFVSAGLSAVAGGAIGRNLTIARNLGREGQLLASIVVGGTISELTGGKFANGAITAAFAAAVSYAKWSQINRNTYGRTIEMDAAEAEEIWKKVRAAAEEMGVDMSPKRVEWINQYALKNGKETVTVDTYAEGLNYLRKGYTWLNGFELNGHITIYRGAIAGVFEYINIGTDLIDSTWLRNYTGFKAGLYVVAHEDEHTRQNNGTRDWELRANSFGDRIVRDYCLSHPSGC